MLKDLSITVLLVAVFVIVIECALRVAGVKYDASFYRLDRDLGYVHRPYAEGWNVKEHEVHIRISGQGLRDVEHAVRRPAGVIRIAVVGDSFSEAREVEQSDAYWSVMERDLNRRMPPGGPRIEVINFGVDGYGLAQEYFVIQHKIWEYDPQIVVMSGTLYSIILHSSRRWGTVAAEGPVPYFVRRDGALVLDDISQREQRAFVPPTAWSDEVADLSNSSRLLSLINVARRKAASGVSTLERDLKRTLRGHAAAAPAAPTATSAAAAEPGAAAPGAAVPGAAVPGAAAEGTADAEKLVLRGPVNSDLADAWDVGEDLIRLSYAETVRHHAEFWMFLLDMAPQVDPDAERRAAVQRELNLPDLFLADKRFADFATREQIPYDTIAPGMLDYAEAHHAVLHGFKNRPRNSGHWNELGHEVAGGLIADKLARCSKVIRDAWPALAGDAQLTCNAPLTQ